MVKEIPLTQGKHALVDDDDYEWLNQWKWSVHKKVRHGITTYTAVRFQKVHEIKNGVRKGIHMHREITHAVEGMVVDHMNHNTLDNRKENLRVVTHQVNCTNRVTQQNNKSGYVGVNFHNGRQTWRAFVGRSGTPTYKHVGTFKSKIEAALAYDDVVEPRDYLVLNFPVYSNKNVNCEFVLNNCKLIPAI